MPVEVRYVTDPACPGSWTLEPTVRRLQVEFGDEVRFTYVMGGLARDYTSGYDASIALWLDHAGRSGMPIDPGLWTEGPIASTYPACMAVKAAAEQAPDGGGAYLRALREGLLCFRRKLDTTEALVEEARGAALDVKRFRIDLASHAIVEAFGADLEEARGVELPSMRFGDGDWLHGVRPYAEYREAVGTSPTGGPLGVEEALALFGRLAGPEVEAVCDLSEERAAAELWRLASERKARPVRVLAGHLWEPLS